MSERINTPFTNEHFVTFCEKMIGMPYWYGTVVYKCTENLRARKAKQYPAHYGSSRTSRYRNDIAKKKVCADCVGLIKGYIRIPHRLRRVRFLLWCQGMALEQQVSQDHLSLQPQVP